MSYAEGARGTLSERFWAKVERWDPDWCWEWTAAKRAGYGKFEVRKRAVRAHRFAYELLVGPVPVGLELDHLCSNKACINPKHLEPVTHHENLRRADRRLAAHCMRGHSLIPENLYLHRNGTRECRTCKRARHRNWMRRQREEERGAWKHSSA